MPNLSKLLVVTGCLLILVAVISRVTWFPIIIAARPIKSISFVILANASFLLALLFKK